ncbi:SsrA-binding protein SmpB [Aliiglaciecola lipolytica]|uniref:SsrA-binding protein n=1 Tax=Aliiglaciecola lipolytica E3 TaxID=1127673 RepID=K6Y8Y5_9ALTE|nr:SsrA-binding protein SmpB [Aliiglaciecola lipolytica]GAC14667.1 SsrA-binding protein [Aliiglaciecola lipolytica E3]
MKKKNAKSNQSNTIALNKKARHEYHLQDKIEAGIELQGWEVKGIRAGKVNLTDSFVNIHNGEAFLQGCKITPLNQASSHVVCDPDRHKKLLIHRREIDRLMGARERQGYSIIATAMYWKQCWVKVEIYLAKGKDAHDKRDTVKDRDWARQKERVMKHSA